MNPVTRHLLDRIDDPELADFALAWDELEEVIVEIYRTAASTPSLRQAFDQRRSSCARLHPQFRAALVPHWQAAQREGRALSRDPFDRVFLLTGAAEVIDNLELLRDLPPAREALNGLLLERAVG